MNVELRGAYDPQRTHRRALRVRSGRRSSRPAQRKPERRTHTRRVSRKSHSAFSRAREGLQARRAGSKRQERSGSEPSGKRQVRREGTRLPPWRPRFMRRRAGSGVAGLIVGALEGWGQPRTGEDRTASLGSNHGTAAAQNQTNRVSQAAENGIRDVPGRTPWSEGRVKDVKSVAPTSTR